MSVDLIWYTLAVLVLYNVVDFIYDLWVHRSSNDTEDV
jgi:hypothetical protein